MLTRARNIARKNEEPTLALRTLTTWSWVAYFAHRYEEAREVGEHARALAQELGDLRAEAYALGSFARSLDRMGDSRSHEYYEKTVETCEKLRDRRHLAITSRAAGEAAFKRADFTRARELFTRSANLRGAGRPNFGSMAIASETGDVDEMHEQAERFLSVLHEDKPHLVGLGSMCVNALKSNDPWLRDIVKSLAPRGMGETSAAAEEQAAVWEARALLCAVTHDKKTASELCASRMDIDLGDVGRESQMAVLARTAGLFDKAIGIFEKVQNFLHRAQQPLLEYWNAFWWAETLLERGAPGDAERAQVLIEETITAARECGMVLVETRSRKLLESIYTKAGDESKQSRR